MAARLNCGEFVFIGPYAGLHIMKAVSSSVFILFVK